MLFFQATAGPPQELSTKLEERGVKGDASYSSNWRFVTHYGITADDIDYALDTVDSVFREYAKG